MKKISTLIAFATIPLLGLTQNPIIFQPGPGQNNSTDQGGLNSGKDAWINEGDYSYNGGADPYEISLPISNCNPTNTVAYFQFDLTGLPASPDSVFFGVTHFDHTTYCYSNCNADFYFGTVISPWDEQTVNYGIFPDWINSFYGPINVAFPNSFGNREYDITTMYNQWKNGTVPNYGFSVYSPTVGCNNAAVYFYVHSSDDTDAATRPYLKIYTSTNGITENTIAANFSVSPNPASNFITINSNGEKIERVQLFDVLGKIILEETASATQYKLDVQGIDQGIYFINIYTSNGKATKQVVIAK